MRNAQGYAALTDRVTGNVTAERETFTCNHCSRIVHVAARADPANIGGMCKLCMKLICPRCVGGRCIPWVEKIDRLEARIERQRWYDTGRR
jgi:hypothetical protein